MVEGGGSQLCSEQFASSLTHLIQIFSLLTKSSMNSVQTRKTYKNEHSSGSPALDLYTN